MKIPRVSDLSGMSFSSIFVLLSETDQQTYLHASMCEVYKMHSSMKSRVLTDFLSVLARDGILLNDFHDANDAFRCSL